MNKELVKILGVFAFLIFVLIVAIYYNIKFYKEGKKNGKNII